MAKQEEVVPPALNRTAQQLFWVGHGQTHCLLVGGFEHVDKFEDILEDKVIDNPLVFGTWFLFRMVSMLLLQGSKHSDERAIRRSFRRFQLPLGSKTKPSQKMHCLVITLRRIVLMCRYLITISSKVSSELHTNIFKCISFHLYWGGAYCSEQYLC